MAQRQDQRGSGGGIRFDGQPLPENFRIDSIIGHSIDDVTSRRGIGRMAQERPDRLECSEPDQSQGRVGLPFGEDFLLGVRRLF